MSKINSVLAFYCILCLTYPIPRQPSGHYINGPESYSFDGKKFRYVYRLGWKQRISHGTYRLQSPNTIILNSSYDTDSIPSKVSYLNNDQTCYYIRIIPEIIGIDSVNNFVRFNILANGLSYPLINNILKLDSSIHINQVKILCTLKGVIKPTPIEYICTKPVQIKRAGNIIRFKFSIDDFYSNKMINDTLFFTSKYIYTKRIPAQKFKKA